MRCTLIVQSPWIWWRCLCVCHRCLLPSTIDDECSNYNNSALSFTMHELIMQAWAQVSQITMSLAPMLKHVLQAAQTLARAATEAQHKQTAPCLALEAPLWVSQPFLGDMIPRSTTS